MAAPAAGLPQTSAFEPKASVRGGLIAAVAELSLLATSAEQLQEFLSPLLRRGGEGVQAAQSLDEITQHLHGLGEFLAAIAGDCSPEWKLDLREVAQRLRLHAQKQRLTSTEGGANDAAIPPPKPLASGELDLW